jgi:Mg2+/Co2+ transporter CorB
MGWDLPTDGPKTLNGLLLEKLETIPSAGTSLRIGKLDMEVLQIADNAIRTVRVLERSVDPSDEESAND